MDSLSKCVQGCANRCRSGRSWSWTGGVRMPSLTGLLQKLFCRKAAFSRVEAAIFEAIRSKLSPSDAELLAKQLEAVNKIYRAPGGREVNLYVMRNGKLGFPRELLFPKTGEFKIAVVDFMAKEGAKKLRARVWCVGGHIFLIAYKTSPEEFEKVTQGKWKAECKILNYPS